MNMIFGLGSGRCGTKSLAQLVNAQPEAVCFHEMNPSSMAWFGAEATVISLLRDFRAILGGEERAVTVDRASPSRTAPLDRLMQLDRVDVIGDVGIYYLPYVELILERHPLTRFPCLQRDKDEVVRSYVEKLRVVTKPTARKRPFAGLLRRPVANASAVPASRNHWAGTSDLRWHRDARWDKCFPQYQYMGATGLAEHVARFYDEYYERAALLEARHPENVRIFDIDLLNSAAGRAEIVGFCCPGREVLDFPVHENAGAAHGTRPERKQETIA